MLSSAPERASEEVFARRLRPDERILWVGQPSTRMGFGIDILSGAGCFVGVLTAFLLWVEIACLRALVSIITHPSSKYTVMDGLVQVAIPIGFWLSTYYTFTRPQRREKRERRKLFYAVTNQRVLILQKGDQDSFTGYDLQELHRMNKWADSSGVGYILFGEFAGAVPTESAAMPRNAAITQPTAGFFCIKDVDGVFRLISELRDGSEA